jgi:recombination protein RecR
MTFTPAVDRLIQAFRCLPGVGPRSAQRMVFHLLERDREGGAELSAALSVAMERVGHCERCRLFAETELCAICANDQRDPKLICVVETPADVLAVESAGSYSGHYFVLMGKLSPLDGIGPDDLGLEALDSILSADTVEEMILATSATVEGEATAHYLAGMAQGHGVAVSRIAQGVPRGGELEYLDGGTLGQAIADRKLV